MLDQKNPVSVLVVLPSLRKKTASRKCVVYGQDIFYVNFEKELWFVIILKYFDFNSVL